MRPCCVGYAISAARLGHITLSAVPASQETLRPNGFLLFSPCGALAFPAGLGKRPEVVTGRDAGHSASRHGMPRGRARAPDRWGKREGSRNSGSLFFWVLFFGETKKSASTAVREPHY